MDRLQELINSTFFRDTCEAEKIAHAGPKGAIYTNLLEAHSALLKARSLSRSRARGDRALRTVRLRRAVRDRERP